MSEIVMNGVVGWLAENDRPELRELLAAGPTQLARVLKDNWLPENWNVEREAEGEFSVQYSPDTLDAQDAATADVRRLDGAGCTWGRLSEQEKETVLEAADVLSPGVRGDLRRMLDQSAPLELSED